MPFSYIIIPFLTAFTGWFAIWLLYKFSFYPSSPRKVLGYTMQGIIPAKLPEIQHSISEFAVEKVMDVDEMERKITDPKHMDKVMPMAEEQIDNFLRNKLKVVFPMIEMFIGDKTITQLKEVFMEELKTLFPAGLKIYVDSLKENIDTKKIVNEKIANAFEHTVLPALEKNMWHQLKKTAMAAGCFGFFVGIIEVVLVKLLQ